MAIKRTSRLLLSSLPAFLIAILLSMFGGFTSAQDAIGDDYGTWHAKGTASERGSFIWQRNRTGGAIEVCFRNDRFCEERDGFLTYFGLRSDMAMDRSYTIVVDSQFENPRIEVSTFYDSLYIEDYAVHLGIDVREFADEVGLNPICEGIITDFPAKVCDSVQMIPVGKIYAVNSFGSHKLEFRPVPDDIGAYLITVSAFDRRDTGQYSISMVQNE